MYFVTGAPDVEGAMAASTTAKVRRARPTKRTSIVAKDKEGEVKQKGTNVATPICVPLVGSMSVMVCAKQEIKHKHEPKRTAQRRGAPCSIITPNLAKRMQCTKNSKIYLIQAFFHTYVYDIRMLFKNGLESIPYTTRKGGRNYYIQKLRLLLCWEND